MAKRFIEENPNGCFICGDANSNQNDGFVMPYSSHTEFFGKFVCASCLREILEPILRLVQSAKSNKDETK